MYKIKILYAIFSQQFRQVSENTCGIYSLKFLSFILDIEDNVENYFYKANHKWDDPISALALTEYLDNEKVEYDAYSTFLSDLNFKDGNVCICEGIVKHHFVSIYKTNSTHIWYFDSELGNIKKIKKNCDYKVNIIEITDIGSHEKWVNNTDTTKVDYIITCFLAMCVTILTSILSFYIWYGSDMLSINDMSIFIKSSIFFFSILLLKNLAEYMNVKYIENRVYNKTLEVNEAIQKLNLEKISSIFGKNVLLHRLERVREILEMSYTIKLNMFFNFISFVFLFFALFYLNTIIFPVILVCLIMLLTVLIVNILKYMRLQTSYHENEIKVKNNLMKSEKVTFVDNTYKMELTHNIEMFQIDFDTLNRFIISLCSFIITLIGLIMIFLNAVSIGSVITYLSLSSMLLLYFDNFAKLTIQYLEYGYTRNMINEILECE